MAGAALLRGAVFVTGKRERADPERRGFMPAAGQWLTGREK